MIEFGEIVKRLTLHEGCVLEEYKCPAGYRTIGIGHNLEANPLDCGKEITKEQAIKILNDDVKVCINQLHKNIPFYFSLDDERQYALLDMCFNLGIYRLLKFKKMLGAMFIGDYRGASKECLNSKYARDVGKRAERIAKLIEKGLWEI